MSDTSELHRLWAGVFGEPPPADVSLPLFCELLVTYLPQAPPYRPGAGGAKAAGEGAKRRVASSSATPPAAPDP